MSSFDIHKKSDLICVDGSNFTKTKNGIVTCYLVEVKFEVCDYESAIQLRKLIQWYEYIGQRDESWDKVCGILIANRFTNIGLNLLWVADCRSFQWTESSDEFAIKEICSENNKVNTDFLK